MQKLKKKHPLVLRHVPVTLYTSLLFFLILFTAAFISSFWSTLSTTNIKPTTKTVANQTLAVNVPSREETTKQSSTLLNCSRGNQTTCSSDYRTISSETEKNEATCPEYFRWIHEDLKPWKEKGISREMLEMAKKTAHFRLVVKNGKGYVEIYKESIQTRSVFTIWGILQLLRRYPGKVADMEMMFDCNDKPVVPVGLYDGPNVRGPPPVFGYCVDRWTRDIVFPDWSFWGWPEINIRPWEHVLKEIKEGNKMVKWKDREPYAYWKGNPYTAAIRLDFLNCNVSTDHDWNLRIFTQTNVHTDTKFILKVEWGNNNNQKVQEIGKAGSRFIHEDLNMDYIYDYMFHLLNEYAKLVKFEPRVPEGAVELCPESMACTRPHSTEKEFMSESMVNEPSTKDPCLLPPPFEPTSLRIFYATKQNWENSE